MDFSFRQLSQVIVILRFCACFFIILFHEKEVGKDSMGIFLILPLQCVFCFLFLEVGIILVIFCFCLQDLSFVDFSYACLKHVFFSRANLQCAKLRVGYCDQLSPSFISDQSLTGAIYLLCYFWYSWHRMLMLKDLFSTMLPCASKILEIRQFNMLTLLCIMPLPMVQLLRKKIVWNADYDLIVHPNFQR